ncbi:hypothetical protein ACFWOB_17160 [Streptomyces sp. NPDC058420]|uniref:hypothetical protein n=1 Tax=Streptomyces sp. NPDC058420 TaxID=3346489 RepID=UPI003661807E
MSTNSSSTNRLSANTDFTPAELRRRLVDAHVSVPRHSRVRAAAAIQGAQAARNVCTQKASPAPEARRARHWE